MAKIAIDIKKGVLQKQDVVAGIDLGTTNSLIAVVDPETRNAYCLGEQGSIIVPSVVHIDEAGKPYVGIIAKNALIHHPESTIFSVKRLLGRSYKDVAEHAAYYTYRIIDENADQLVKIEASGRYFSPVELSSFILAELKLQGEKTLGKPITKAVISVPAYFNDNQRQATRDAGKMAGLDVLRIVNEPTAASLAYGLGLQNDSARTILVYDLGGGTFDVSVLLIENGVFEVLSTRGDTYLGGDDVDRRISNLWLSKNDLSSEKLGPGTIQELRLKAEAAKIELSNGAQNFSDFITLEAGEIILSLNEGEFDAIVAEIVNKTMQCVADALKDAGLRTSEIDEVVLVGGSTRLPQVRRELRNSFGKAKVNHNIDADQVVALGAAIEADILAGNRKDILLLDVTPLSLGIETAGGLMDVIIPRNNKIPTKAARQYTTSVDGQVNMKISVYQGERELVAENRKLAEFELRGIPAMPAGLPKVEIGFLLDADGILKVSATELRSGVSQQIEVKPQYGLSDDMVENMLLESLKHAGDDMSARMLLESRTEGRQLIYTAERFISKNGDMLTAEEISHTRVLINQLSEALTSEDRNVINTKIDTLNEYTRPFAERVMDAAVSQALKGTSVD